MGLQVVTPYKWPKIHGVTGVKVPTYGTYKPILELVRAHFVVNLFVFALPPNLIEINAQVKFLIISCRVIGAS